jgi:hypothetical protein
MRALHGQAIDAISEELRSPGPMRWKLALEVIKYTGFGTPILSAVGPTDPEEIVEDACQANRQRGLTPDPPMARVDSAVGTRKQVPF